MHKLEQLYGKLDIPDPAAAKFYLSLGEALAGHFVLGAGLHGPQRPQLVGAERTAPNPFGGLLGKGAAQFGVASCWPGFEQRLELPRLCPPVPIREVGGEATNERPGTTFGAEGQVYTPRWAGDEEHRLGVAAADQEYVDVTPVVELPGAQLPHRYDCQFVTHARLLGGRAEYAIGKVCQRRADLLERDGAGQVEGGDTQDFESFPARKRLQRLDRLVERRQDVEGSRVGDAGARKERARRHDIHGGSEERALLAEPLHRTGHGLGQARKPELHPHRVGGTSYFR